MTKPLVWYLVFLIAFISLAPRVDAAFVSSEMSTGAFGDRHSERQRVEAFLERKVVKDRLLDLGFTMHEVENKLSGLSESQVHDLAGRIEDVKVGGSAEGVIIGVLIVLFVIGVLLPLLGIRVWR